MHYWDAIPPREFMALGRVLHWRRLRLTHNSINWRVSLIARILQERTLSRPGRRLCCPYLMLLLLKALILCTILRTARKEARGNVCLQPENLPQHHQQPASTASEYTYKSRNGNRISFSHRTGVAGFPMGASFQFSPITHQHTSHCWKWFTVIAGQIATHSDAPVKNTDLNARLLVECVLRWKLPQLKCTRSRFGTRWHWRAITKIAKQRTWLSIYMLTWPIYIIFSSSNHVKQGDPIYCLIKSWRE